MYTDGERARLLDIGQDVDKGLKKLRASLKVAEEAPMLFGVGTAPLRQMKFQWDAGNIRHILHDHPERRFTVEEIESLWTDPYRLTEQDDISQSGEIEYVCLARSNRNRLLYVFFVERNGQIRPFSGRPATRRIQVERYEAHRKNLGG